MTGWQITILVLAVLLTAVAGLLAVASPQESGQAMPIATLMFWPAALMALFGWIGFGLSWL